MGEQPRRKNDLSHRLQGRSWGRPAADLNPPAGTELLKWGRTRESLGELLKAQVLGRTPRDAGLIGLEHSLGLRDGFKAPRVLLITAKMEATGLRGAWRNPRPVPLKLQCAVTPKQWMGEGPRPPTQPERVYDL